MNLADIRKKAQQAQKKKGERYPVPVATPPRFPEVPPLPMSLGCPAIAELAAPPAFPENLGAAPVPPPPADRPLFESIAPAAVPSEEGERQLRSPSPQPSAAPAAGPEAFAAVPEVPVITFPAIVGAPSPPLPKAPEEPFDPLAVILAGRELAEAGELQAALAPEEAASLELLCFRVATEEYAINIMDIKEIIRPREVTEVPRVPAFVRGILSLRGVIIPVFDMRLRLGLPSRGGTDRERVVVVKREIGFCGVLVDEVVQVVRIPVQGIEPPPVVLEGIDREFVEGIGRVNGRMLILLDMDKVLDVALA